ncbi:mediator of RNA polymerase II transcription subunit 1-like isoform X1 [Nerophis lumbriciformis]|uniref:mediator of RNA polymerase II transcription subunit 1-like isoform X1 n=2 Tax=Nerophis lumbriciformis TaxID=546530 RepID=UPI002ADF398C|nr:mediator of RNA polymerase II transcription subunit 1-like isoform X1 [Nerophis lumbriciformis]
MFGCSSELARCSSQLTDAMLADKSLPTPFVCTNEEDFQRAAMSSIISELHLKYAAKTWNDTFQLVRRCMDTTRDNSKPCEPLVRALKRLQEVLNVSSMNVMRSRLEMIAKQHGMGFHFTEATCYLTADLFYLEVALLPCGGVEEVKVAPHGGAPVRSEAFLQLLKSKHFAGFSAKLKDLFTQYNIPGDNDVKFKLFAALQHLSKDLQEMCHLPRVANESCYQMDVVNNSILGCFIPGKEDCPLTLQFYSARAGEVTTNLKADPQVAQIAVCPSHVTHRLQIASVLPLPLQLDNQGYPVFTPWTDVPHETFPACFVLKLQPAIPIMVPFVDKISRITEVAIPNSDLQWAPFPHLLTGSDGQDNVFTLRLSGDAVHTYVFPGEAWDSPAHKGVMMDSVPFTHPVHVPNLVEVLRHQCVINTLLSSCTSPGPVSACDQHFEIRLETDTSFSVTFHRPHLDSLAVLLVDIPNSHQLACRLFGAGMDASLDGHVSDIMKRCMSVPLTLQALYIKMEDAPPPVSILAMAENEPSTSSCVLMEDLSAPKQEENLAASEHLNVSPSAAAANLCPVAPEGVVEPCLTNNGQQSELV